MKKRIAKIADYFEVSTDYLLGKTDNPTPHSAEKSLDEQLDGLSFALYGEVKDFDDDDKEKLLEYVKFLKQQKEKDK